MTPATGLQIVHRQSGSRRSGARWLWLVIAIVWLASLGVMWWLATRTAAPRLGEAEAALQQAMRIQVQQRRQIEQLQRRQVNLAMSDKISRAANTQVQASLAQRDEQIAALRADVAFYERLVGSTAQRKGLNAHSVQFTAETGGIWSYRVVLTQNLNRGVISQGQLRLAVEGVRADRLVTVSWNELLQKPDAAGQPYSFRYFQQLHGSVILPKDFTPQRVKIFLSGDGAPVQQTFDWKVAANGAEE